MSIISRRAKRWDHSGVNLGGIGAGKIEFCPSGRFSNVMTQNNWDQPVGNVRAELRPVYDREGIPGAFLAAWVEGAGAVTLKEKPRPGFKGLRPGQIRYEGRLPRALVTYPRMNGVELSVEAFSSLSLDSDGKDRYRDSSLPAAVFVFTFRNTTRKSRRVSALMSWMQLVGMGGFADAQINDERDRRITCRKETGRVGVVFDSITPRVSPRVEGTNVLMTETSRARRVTCLAGYHQGALTGGAATAKGLWDSFSRDGTLPQDPAETEPYKHVHGSAALASSARLRPGAALRIPFVLAWFFPNLIARSNRKVNYGHAYQNWFRSAWEVTGYVLRERGRLYAQTRAWQKTLEDSNLPDWLVEKLANDLFSVYACSWYTRDYRHTVNESPTDMGGCHGTIDQRAAASAIVDMCFPALSRSELTLFASQQIGVRHPDRIGRHWDMKKGRFGKRLDRRGAIRHDVGWDDLEGGGFGSPLWQNIHWPDLTSVFVLECWRTILWTGDGKFLRWVYPRVKAALDFQTRLDQNGDGVADLWGHGSNTYDSGDLHYYGASAFIASLYLAANLAGEEMAQVLGDKGFARTCRRRFQRARKTYDTVIWNDRHRHFNSWVDTNHRAWKGTDREHGPSSDSSMIAQIAGQWFSNLLGMRDITDRGRIADALKAVFRMNVSLPKGCPAIDATHQGTHNYSWPQYSETYYAASAIYEGRPDEGMHAVRRIYKAQYTRDGSPWDTSLKWAGDENDQPAWGRWYMTNPASWFLLPAITGVGVDHLRGVLTVAPNIPKEMGGGKRLSRVPVFFPRFHATVDCVVMKRGRKIRMRVTRLIGGKPVRFRRLRLAASDRLPKIRLNGRPLRVKSSLDAGRFIELDVNVRFTAEGDVLEVRT